MDSGHAVNDDEGIAQRSVGCDMRDVPSATGFRSFRLRDNVGKSYSSDGVTQWGAELVVQQMFDIAIARRYARLMPSVPLTLDPGLLVGPVKRSITIAGHQTSISLEPVFWSALDAAAVAHGLPLSALVAQIDAVRITVNDPPNLASAIRTWLFTSATLG